MAIKIYVNYLNPSHIVESKILTPLQVGRAMSKTKLNMLGDDEGDNISAKNPAYCELTGQYWAWKNDKTSDYLGIMHYRRFLNFYPSSQYETDPVCGIIEPIFSGDFFEKHGLTDEHMEAVIRDYDMVIPEPLDVRCQGSHSVAHHYMLCHHEQDFKVTQAVITEMYPQDTHYFNKMATSPLLHHTNIFIFKRALFEEYCTWLFPLLARIETTLDTSSYDTYGKRAISFLAERLLTVFVLKKLDTNPNLKIKELKIIFIQDTSLTPTAPPLPITKLPIVSIAAATDRTYLPHIGALIASTLSNADHHQFIDFMVLENKLTVHEKYSLIHLEKLHPHCKISFIDMSQKFSYLKINLHFTKASLYRLMLPDILVNRDKVLYLDSDMIILDNIGELFKISFDGKMAAVTRDFFMQAFCAIQVKSQFDTGNQPANEYLANYLSLSDKSGDYFQSGILLLDLKKLREIPIFPKAIQDVFTTKFWFADQDVLNKHLLGKVKFIDNAWNVMVFDEWHQSHLTPDNQNRYDNAQQFPKIIHFAGRDKPWKNSNHPLGHYYWYYLRTTPWYERILFEYMVDLYPTTTKKNSLLKMGLSRIWRKLPKFLQTALKPIATQLVAIIQ